MDHLCNKRVYIERPENLRGGGLLKLKQRGEFLLSPSLSLSVSISVVILAQHTYKISENNLAAPARVDFTIDRNLGTAGGS